LNQTTVRRAAIGLGVLAVYVVAAGATVRLTDHHVRPLFEGIGPAPPYQWVEPPPQFAIGNVKPHGNAVNVPLGPAGSALTSLSSGDAQVVVNIPEGAVPPHPPDTSVEMGFEPLAPNRFAAPPSGLRADGNVYRVTLTYKPSGQRLDAVAKAGNIVMAVPEPGESLLWSADGKGWERLQTQPVGGPTVLGARFERAGYYLGATLPLPAAKKSSTGTIVLVLAIVIGLAALLGGGPVLLRRLRAPKAGGATSRRPPTGSKPRRR
jgi:hypothetical protein